MDVAAALGAVIDVEGLLPSSGIPTVQCLRPRAATQVGTNQYSGHYGLGAFPLHSDLAHWAVPPHYFILRCIVPAEDVFTQVLRWTVVTPLLGTIDMRKAVFTGRKRRIGCSGLVRAMSRHGNTGLFRWDPLFLKPLNQSARDLDRLMREPRWSEAGTEVPLRRPGDTLVIDNWQVLHGRSPIPLHSTGRLLERVYLSDVLR
jgi:hypothetical protein